MKIWILMIFRLAGELEKQIENLDKRIERVAVNPFGITLKQYEAVLELSDRKSRLVNLKIMYELLLRRLSGDDVFLIAKYASGVSVAEIAQRLQMRASAAYKRINRAIDRAIAELAGAGFDEERMEIEYRDFPAVTVVLNTLKGKARKSGFAVTAA